MLVFSTVSLISAVACFYAAGELFFSVFPIISYPLNQNDPDPMFSVIYIKFLFFSVVMIQEYEHVHIKQNFEISCEFLSYFLGWLVLFLKNFCNCNSSLFNQLWKTEAAETGLYSRILRVFQNSLPPDVIDICILMLYQCGRALEVRLSEIRRRISK